MPPTKLPEVPPTPQKSSVSKWLASIALVSIWLSITSIRYASNKDIDKESSWFHFLSFISPLSLYVAIAAGIALGLWYVYQRQNNVGDVMYLGMRALKKYALYVLLPSVVITAIIIIWAMSTGNLVTSKTSFW